VKIRQNFWHIWGVPAHDVLSENEFHEGFLKHSGRAIDELNLKKNSHHDSSNRTSNFEKLKNSEKPKILGVDPTWDFGTPYHPPTRDIYFAPKNPLENEIWGKTRKI